MRIFNRAKVLLDRRSEDYSINSLGNLQPDTLSLIMSEGSFILHVFFCLYHAFLYLVILVKLLAVSIRSAVSHENESLSIAWRFGVICQ